MNDKIFFGKKALIYNKTKLYSKKKKKIVVQDLKKNNSKINILSFGDSVKQKENGFYICSLVRMYF